MNSKKESVVKIKKYQEKYESERRKNFGLRKENKYLRRRKKELTNSRDSWKEKSKSKGLEVKELKHEINRKGKIKRHHYPFSIMFLAVSLRVCCSCSYISISKILKLFGSYLNFNLEKYPCANTVQNWVSKVGYFSLEKENKGLLKGKRLSLIIDESIRLGQEKLLLILSVPYEKIKAGALKFKEVNVLYMKAQRSWVGEDIKKILEGLEQKYEFEIGNILSDEAGTLKKASKLFGVVHLPDIMHALATCLRKTFEKDIDYQSFIKLISLYQRKAVNQALTFLCPPKQRTKARFMNQFNIVKWANKMLMFFDQLQSKERAFFEQLPAHQNMIRSLYSCIMISKNIAAIFRNLGLCTQTLEIIKQIINSTKGTDKYINAFIGHVHEYLTKKYQVFVENNPSHAYHVSSEVIESLFGKYKDKAAYCKLTGLTNLNLELPVLCIEENQLERQIGRAIEGIFMTDLKKWRKTYSTDNQLIKRMNFFKNGTNNSAF